MTPNHQPLSLTLILLSALAMLPVMAQPQIVDPVNRAYLSGVYEVLLEIDDARSVASTRLYVNEELLMEKEGWVPAWSLDFGETIDRHELYAEVVTKDGQVIRGDDVITRELRVDLEATSRVILMTAVVKNRNGKPLVGLGQDKFRVLENGQLVEIQNFYNEYLPLDLVFLVDTSSSLIKNDEISRVRVAAATFLDSLEPGDRVNLFEIKSKPINLMPFTTDRKQLRRKIEALKAIGETALLDSMHAAVDALKDRRRGRKAVVLFTDGRDSVYEEPTDKARLFRKAITRAQNNEIAMFIIGLGKHINRDAMTVLAEETGGGFYFAPNIDRIGQVFDQIVLDLKHQYVLGILPQSRGGFNSIEIKVRARGAKVYSRKGYTLE